MPVILFVYHRCSLDCDNSRNILHHLFLEKNGRIAHFSKRRGVIFKEGHARKTISQETKKIKRLRLHTTETLQSLIFIYIQIKVSLYLEKLHVNTMLKIA